MLFMGRNNCNNPSKINDFNASENNEEAKKSVLKISLLIEIME